MGILDLAADAMTAGHRILLIDDDADLRDVVVALLEDAGYSVTSCAEPETALELLQHSGFDLILTDGFSSTPHGALEATAPLLEAAVNTPVALFSGHTFPLADVHAAGFRGVIAKPFDIDLFEQQVKSYLSG